MRHSRSPALENGRRIHQALGSAGLMVSADGSARSGPASDDELSDDNDGLYLSIAPPSFGINTPQRRSSPCRTRLRGRADGQPHGPPESGRRNVYSAKVYVGCRANAAVPYSCRLRTGVAHLRERPPELVRRASDRALSTLLRDFFMTAALRDDSAHILALQVIVPEPKRPLLRKPTSWQLQSTCLLCWWEIF